MISLKKFKKLVVSISEIPDLTNKEKLDLLTIRLKEQEKLEKKIKSIYPINYN
jgi:hypothetical protein